MIHQGAGFVVFCALAVVPGARAHQLGDAARALLQGPEETRSVEITDGFADYVRRVTNSSSRVYADLSVVKRYAQAGCKRLRVVVRAPDAVAVDPATGRSQSFWFTYEMDVCQDGSAPLKR